MAGLGEGPRGYMGLEALSAQRDLLADAELFEGGWETSAAFIRGLRAVTPEDVRRVMAEHVGDLQVGFYGDPSRLDEDLVTHDPAEAAGLLFQRSGLTGPSPSGDVEQQDSTR